MASRAQLATALTRHAPGGEWVEVFPAEWSTMAENGPTPLLAEDSEGYWICKVYRNRADMIRDNSSTVHPKSRPVIVFSIPCPNIVEAGAEDIGNLAAVANATVKITAELMKLLK